MNTLLIDVHPWTSSLLYQASAIRLKQADELPAYIAHLSGGTAAYEQAIRTAWTDFKRNPSESNADKFADFLIDFSSTQWPEVMAAILGVESLTPAQRQVLEEALSEHHEYIKTSLLPDITRVASRTEGREEGLASLDYRTVFLYAGALWAFGSLATIMFDGLSVRDLADVFLFAGPNDEATCTGERGCEQYVGKLLTVAEILADNILPGRLRCLTNCRHMLLSVASPLKKKKKKHLPGQHDQKSHGRGYGIVVGHAGYNLEVPAKYPTGPYGKAQSITLRATQDPVMYHGTYADSAEAIARGGFKVSETGTAGRGVYLTDEAGDALYERNPGLSEAVMAHGGAQPDTLVEVQVHGKVLDVGEIGATKYSPSLYLRPNIYAAMVLELEAGRDPSIGALMDGEGAGATAVIRDAGYVGLSWSFPGGKRRGTVVFDPNDVEVRSVRKVKHLPGRHDQGTHAPHTHRSELATYPNALMYMGTDAAQAEALRTKGFDWTNRSSVLTVHTSPLVTQQGAETVLPVRFTGRALRIPGFDPIEFNESEVRAQLLAVGADAVAYRDHNAGGREALAVFEPAMLELVTEKHLPGRHDQQSHDPTKGVHAPRPTRSR